MFIESWVMALIIVFMGATGIVSVLGWMAACGHNDELKAKLEKEIKRNVELHRENHYLRIKNNVQVATNYHNEGKKK